MHRPSIAMFALCFVFLPGPSRAQDPPPAWPSVDDSPASSAAATKGAPSTQVRGASQGIDLYEQRLREAIKAFDDNALLALLNESLPVLAGQTTEFRAQLFLAKCYLARCDLRRFMRKTYELEGKRDKELRKEDATLSEIGLPYAQRAAELDPHSSEAYRVAGELLIHHITGPIAGFRYGPKGKRNIEKAIELDPSNAEARRAIGLMYLYNPPINGGDPVKAAQTFDQAIQMGGDDRAYVLSARAYFKLENKITAAERIQQALKINPKNVEAKALWGQITK